MTKDKGEVIATFAAELLEHKNIDINHRLHFQSVHAGCGVISPFIHGACVQKNNITII